MGSDSVFYFSGTQITPLAARDFRSGLFGKTLEDALQTLIESEPNLLNGRQMEPGSNDPPRFALLRREMPVGDWSVDHLLVDQRAVLTLVETKLVQNRESRRDVIGQILEYAANAERSWGAGRLRQFAAEHWQKAGRAVDDVVRAAFGDIDVDAFWVQIERNLAQGRLRLVIAADELRPEVRRIIEFLNQQFRTLQVFGLEVRCFADHPDSGVIVSYLVGRTQAAVDDKERTRPVTAWTVDNLRAFYEAQGAPCSRAGQLLAWAAERGCVLVGRTQQPIFSLRSRGDGRIATTYPDALYVFLRPGNYPGGLVERDGLVQDLKGAGFYPEGLEPQTVADGRSISRPLSELDDTDFGRLLGILSRYCGTSGQLPEVAMSEEPKDVMTLNVEGPENSDWLKSQRSMQRSE